MASAPHFIIWLSLRRKGMRFRVKDVGMGWVSLGRPLLNAYFCDRKHFGASPAVIVPPADFRLNGLATTCGV